MTEAELTTPDGTTFPADVDRRPIIDRGSSIGWVVTFRDVSDRVAYERRLRRLALTDQLTGLANRTLAVDNLRRALAHLPGDGRHVGVLFCDLDRFKAVNDGLGHAAGDDLLIEVAARLGRVVRSTDTVARVGGDEFLIVCPVLEDPQEAVALSDRVAEALAAPVTLLGTEVFLGVSIGVRTTDDPDAEIEQLLADADTAMLEAKTYGRDVVVYDERLRHAAFNRVELDTELRYAIEQDQLVLHYQPTVSLAAGGLTGVEALVRWQHPVHGMIPPMDFIPLAEETGLIGALGEWVIEAAAAQLDEWHTTQPDGRLSMSVNLSGRQLRDRSVVDLTASVLERYSFSPDQWVFEVTETVLMREGDQALDVLAALRELGVRLAIDDFGTGYSSLASLRRFPADILKIDRAFVSGIDGDDANRKLVSAIVGMARALGMATTAEGIEGLPELHVLRQLGCDVGQGFLLGRPGLPVPVITDLLNAMPVPAPARAVHGGSPST